jgi:hypothetical protein
MRHGSMEIMGTLEYWSCIECVILAMTNTNIVHLHQVLTVPRSGTANARAASTGGPFKLPS